MGFRVRLSALEDGVCLREEFGGRGEGLCEAVLAGELHSQRNKGKCTPQKLNFPF